MLQFHPWSVKNQFVSKVKPTKKTHTGFESVLIGIGELVGALIVGALTDGMADLALAGIFGESITGATELSEFGFNVIKGAISFGTYETYNTVLQVAQGQKASFGGWQTGLLTGTLFFLPSVSSFIKSFIKTNQSFSEFIKDATNLAGTDLKNKEILFKQAKQMEEELQNSYKRKSEFDKNFAKNLWNSRKYRKIKEFVDTLEEKVKGTPNKFKKLVNSKFFQFIDETGRYKFRVDNPHPYYKKALISELLRKTDSILMRLNPFYGVKLALRYLLKEANRWIKIGFDVDLLSGIERISNKINPLQYLRKYQQRLSKIQSYGNEFYIKDKNGITRPITMFERKYSQFKKIGDAYYFKRFGFFFLNPNPPQRDRWQVLKGVPGQWIKGIKINFLDSPSLNEIRHLGGLLDVLSQGNINVGSCDILFIFDVISTKSRAFPSGKPPILQKGVNFDAYVLPFLRSASWSKYYYLYIMWGKIFNSVFGKNEIFLNSLLKNQVGNIIGELRWIYFDATGIAELAKILKNPVKFQKFRNGSFWTSSLAWAFLKNTPLRYWASVGGSLGGAVAGGKLTGRTSPYLVATRRLRTKRKYKIAPRRKYNNRF